MPKKIKDLEDEVYNWRFLAKKFGDESRSCYQYFLRIREKARGVCQMCKFSSDSNNKCPYCVHYKLPTEIENCMDLWEIIE